MTPVRSQEAIVASNMDLSLHVWLLSSTPEILLRRSNVGSYWLKQGLRGGGENMSNVVLFWPQYLARKRKCLSPPHICCFLGLPLPHLVPAVPLLLSQTVGSISLFNKLSHAFITTYPTSKQYPVRPEYLDAERGSPHLLLSGSDHACALGFQGCCYPSSVSPHISSE